MNRKVRLLLLTLIVGLCIAFVPGVPTAHAAADSRALRFTASEAWATCTTPAVSFPAWGAMLVSGSQWLGGQGVAVCWNNGASSVKSSGYGTEWQCVELAQRLYNQRGWYVASIFPNTQSAYQIYYNAPSMGFIRHANGDGIPAPGDMIIHAGTNAFPAGHVSVVDYVAGGVVHVVEQNASATGKASYTLSGSTMINRQGFGTILGYVHAPANNSTPPPPPPSTMVKTASAVPSPLHRPADFSLHAGTQIAEYNSTTNSFSYQGTWVQPVGAIDWAAAGDFNGDGVADFAIHANNAIYVYLSTRTSFAFQGSWVSPVGAFDWGGVGDFNGDGKADFALHANNAIYVYLSTGTSFAFQGVWVSPVGAFDWGGVGDFNGDGKADFALHNNGAIYVYLSTGNSFAFQGSWVAPVGAYDWGGVGDFNGDGKADFALHNNGAIYVYLSTGNSFAFQGSWVSPVGAYDWGGVGDVNGDGKADFALHNNGAIYVYLSTGNSFAFQGSWVAPVGAFDSGWLADYNGS